MARSSPFLLLIPLLLATRSQAFPLLDEEKQPGSYFSKEPAPQPWLVSAATRWMEQLPDDTPMNKLSIPGTHDSGALYGTRFCETQSWTIAEQLNSGIRYLDIRNRRALRKFAIHHGICFQNIYFNTVLDQVRHFLNEYAGETVIMRVKEEYTPIEGSDSFASIWARYMDTYGDMFIRDLGTKVPTLGQVRGKVLVLRNAGFSGVGLEYDGPAMVIQDFYKVYPFGSDFPAGDDRVTLDQKKRQIGAYLETAKTSSKMVLNHLSGAVGMFPDDVAEKTNEYAYEKIGPFVATKTTGILAIDYPGARLIYRIIKTNFATSVECIGRTWYALSDATFAKFEIPSSPVGTRFSFRGGAYAIREHIFKCHRSTWTDLEITCGTDGIWNFEGHLDADGLCHSLNTDQDYLFVGERKDL